MVPTVCGRGGRGGTHLVADKVVAGGEVLGEGDGEGVAVHDVLLEPRRAVRLLADLVDLEPFGLTGIELVTGRALAFGEVCEHWACVVRPLYIYGYGINKHVKKLD